MVTAHGGRQGEKNSSKEGVMRSNRLLVRLVLLIVVGQMVGCASGSRDVSISSDPNGATIFLNDALVGQTPLLTTVKDRPGDYSIYVFKAIKDDCLPEQKVFKELLYHETVGDTVPAKIHFSLRKRKKYPITITSEPSGALVTQNGEVIGETPLTWTVMERVGAPRIFDLVAVKQGYLQGEEILREFIAEGNEPQFEFPETIHFKLVQE